MMNGRIRLSSFSRLEADDSNDLKSFTFEADPDEVTFSLAGGLGGALYGTTVTPKPNAGSATKPAVEVTITVTVADKAGNMNMATAMVTLAARTGSGGADPDSTVTDPTDDLTGVTVPGLSYVILVHGTGAAPDVMGLPDTYPGNPAEGSTVTDEQVWEGMPNLEDLLFRGGTITLTVTKAADDALWDHDGDGADATTGLKADDTAGTKPRQYGARDLIITEVMTAVNTAEVGKNRSSHSSVDRNLQSAES